MPSYRSPEEAEIRTAFVDKIRKARPDARIIHEINACMFGNRIDVLAVCPTEIIAGEIKSEKDKLDRAPKQIHAMMGLATHTICAVHEKFLLAEKCTEYSAHYLIGGQPYKGVTPSAVQGDKVWVYPQRSRSMSGRIQQADKWHLPDPAPMTVLPASAIYALWVEELRWMCQWLGIRTKARPVKADMTRDLLWSKSGEDITRGICFALRARKCPEADPPIALPIFERQEMML